MSYNTQSSSAIDFISPNHHDHTARTTDILVQANIVSCLHPDIFYQQPPTYHMQKKIPRLVVDGRVITGKEHCDKLQQRMEDIKK